ncbi:MAG: 50S ribosomal protein L30 [Candidatus Bathyarchaeota archaeon]|nr:MAG: 50S ribosomal protein L30 [Candidatus Bathyarchaeota archaeon]
MEEKHSCLAAIRIRGTIDISGEIKETLKMLHLTRSCHATLIDDRPSYLGMLRKARNYLTWGKISKEDIKLLLERRGRLIGDKKMTEEYAQGIGYESLNALAEALYELKVEYRSLPNIKPVFRLHPPKKGFKGKVKRSYAAGGVAGRRGPAISELIKRMT